MDSLKIHFTGFDRRGENARGTAFWVKTICEEEYGHIVSLPEEVRGRDGMSVDEDATLVQNRKLISCCDVLLVDVGVRWWSQKAYVDSGIAYQAGKLILAVDTPKDFELMEPNLGAYTDTNVRKLEGVSMLGAMVRGSCRRRYGAGYPFPLPTVHDGGAFFHLRDCMETLGWLEEGLTRRKRKTLEEKILPMTR